MDRRKPLSQSSSIYVSEFLGTNCLAEFKLKNGNRHKDKHLKSKLKVNGNHRMEVRLVLTDVLKTKVGQQYLKSCHHDKLTDKPKQKNLNWADGQCAKLQREIRMCEEKTSSCAPSQAKRFCPDILSDVTDARCCTARSRRQQAGSSQAGWKATTRQDTNRVEPVENKAGMSPELLEELEDQTPCMREEGSGSEAPKNHGRPTMGFPNPTVPLISGESRQSVLCVLKKGIVEGVAFKHACLEDSSSVTDPTFLFEDGPSVSWTESLADECAHGRSSAEGGISSETHPSQSPIRKSSAAEPIVLSSDEDEMSSPSRIVQPESLLSPDSAVTPHFLQISVVGEATETNVQAKEILETKETTTVSSIVQLPFTAMHFNDLEVEASGQIMITDHGITIPLKGSVGEMEMSVALQPSQLLGYGLWDVGLEQGSREKGPHLLFLWVTETQAQLLQMELQPVSPSQSLGQSKPFLLLTLADAVEGLQRALLESIITLMVQYSTNRDLMDALTWDQGLALILSLAPGAGILSLLGQETSQGKEAEDQSLSTAEQAVSETVPTEERELTDAYTLRYHRTKDSYMMSIAPRPTDLWSRYQHNGLRRCLIQFPPPPSKGGISVTMEDLECLDSGEFLNDVIIDFYLKYLILEKVPSTVAERCHIFSSFFYKQLTRKDTPGDDATPYSVAHRRHQKVRTWTRHVDIFTKDYLLVPVNQESHWYLVVICFPGMDVDASEASPGELDVGKGGSRQEGSNVEVITKAPSPEGLNLAAGEGEQARRFPLCVLQATDQLSGQREPVCKRPCILIMDSLRLSNHERIFRMLREYLEVEWEVRRGTPRDFSQRCMQGSHCRVPQQDNSSDCGVYLLQYAESFLQDPVVTFDLPLNLENWFPRQHVRRKRDEIRDLVLHLYRKQHGSTDCAM